MAPLVGVFIVPDASDPAGTVAQIEAADAGGLDLVGVQDHPYQRRFLDTWTLLSYAAARTQRVRLVPDVINLPLRPPAVLAKAAASLDLLSRGRVELGLGAGALWDGIGAMGGPVRSPGESVDALVEAIAVLRAMWSGEPSARVAGEHYALNGVHPGPVPAHPIRIWLGAYRPRMLRVTGRLADGWLPSVPRLPLEEVPARQAAIDEAAKAAGRDPAAIVRVANVGRELAGVDALARLVDELGFQGLILSPGGGDDPVDGVRRIATDVAPALRARLAGG
jgi:alkanesulfonate monooxygenase SsuD/methylene tetrahydromethanopterin reductase-like flavin-dependent oxidoreductase (luciferase family)